ncbi:MtnX-like HAD-IB family phosphatase [Dissulfurimicrobium hydrothermale]|uniref:MtnX-like HAD-IB family phosphatase n=1 Tax=Dissulfurimicrobium hydrothermale TaxID=1750598 RepID=UPI001EDBBC87|nr:MtnX-like HAD-IB family phosphatase [Dissulfurimicrobium hydrothermale]UKL13115.1 MtnX-like HAD-IB family phosphatase [Dissulfurimicrobium hydrothermale]
MKKPEMKKPNDIVTFLQGADIFVTIDFDGTITASDITDAVIKEFARPGWEEAERLWEAGQIGSRECLSLQMSLIDQPLERIIKYACSLQIDRYFADFVGFLKRMDIRFAVISDGFRCIIDSIFKKAGIDGVPIYANDLSTCGHGLKTIFNSSEGCRNGTCKCRTADMLACGRPIIHIGDGRSDFCLAGKASYVFSKGKLTDYCRTIGIAYSEFADFAEIERDFKAFLKFVPVSGRTTDKEGIQPGCNII